jgi:tetratricopeptide (TPR) repeat protein
VQSATAQRSLWLFGPWPDLLLGCGLLYALLFGVLVVAGPALRSAQPYALFPLLILALSVPHYGATLLRVYERRSERRAYVLFTVWATLAVGALFLVALWLPPAAAFLVTLYLTWSPWHYTGQNYGISVMFLRRGGVALDPRTKRWLYLSFLLSFVLVFLQMHTGAARMDDLPAGYTSEQGATFVPLGLPVAWSLGLGAIVGTAYAASLAIAGIRLARLRAGRALVPVVLLSLSQVLWFSLPYALRLGGVALALDPLDPAFRSHYFTWIALAHALQYLWVTAYFARQSGAAPSHPRFYAKAALAGAAPWTLPFLLLGPQALGPLAADAGLAFLVAAAVNVHHFVLDGAIWKLRGRIAAVLIRSSAERAEPAPRARRFGVRRAVWAACALALAVHVARLVDDEQLRRSLARRDFASATAAADRVARFGMDRSMVRLTIGQALLRDGQLGAAREQLLRSLALGPTANTWVLLGRTHEGEGAWAPAAEAYERALALGLPREGEVATLARAARAWLMAGAPERARALLARAPPGDPRFRALNERAGALRAESSL